MPEQGSRGGRCALVATSSGPAGISPLPPLVSLGSLAVSDRLRAQKTLTGSRSPSQTLHTTTGPAARPATLAASLPVGPSQQQIQEATSVIRSRRALCHAVCPRAGPVGRPGVRPGRLLRCLTPVRARYRYHHTSLRDGRFRRLYTRRRLRQSGLCRRPRRLQRRRAHLLDYLRHRP